MRKLTSLIVLLVVLGSKVKGQSDTYFVLPPLYEWQAGDHDIFLYISTNAPSASVWIYNSDTSYSQTVAVTSGSVGTVSLTTPVPGLLSTYGARELNWSNSKRYKDALFIESSAPVTVTEQIVEQGWEITSPPKKKCPWKFRQSDLFGHVTYRKGSAIG